jgi:hypothetical protein
MFSTLRYKLFVTPSHLRVRAQVQRPLSFMVCDNKNRHEVWCFCLNIAKGFLLCSSVWHLQVVTVVCDCLDVVFCCLIDFSDGCYWVIGPRVEAWSLVCPSSCSDPLGSLPWRQHLVWMGARALCVQKLRIFVSPGTCFLSSWKRKVISSYQNHAGNVRYGWVLCKMVPPNPRNSPKTT